MKIIYIILGSLLAIFFLSGCGVSLRFFDPQYYKFKYLACCKEGGYHVLDERLYNKKRNRQIEWFTYWFDDPKIDIIQLLDLEPRYGWYMRHNGTGIMQQIDSRIARNISSIHVYIDSSSKMHIISYEVGFYYTDYGIFIGGDEGAGFWVDTSREIYDTNRKNKFILKDGKWVKVEN